MKEICTPKNQETVHAIAPIIMQYIRGGNGQMIKDHLCMTEKMRQFFTWGAHAYKLIGSECGCYGIQFQVSGLIFKGRVRIYYNPSTDYFDVELVRARKEEAIKCFNDIDFMQLHNVLHQNIERTDDMEV